MGINTNVILNGVVAVVSVTLSPTATATSIGVTNTLGASPAASALPITGSGGILTVVVTVPVRARVIWQNDTTRQVQVWFMGGADGTTVLDWAWLYSNDNPGWTVVGTADLDGNGKPDVIWQNDTTRQVTVNYFGGPQGTDYLGWAWLYSSSVPGWRIVGVADFNGDGKPDVIWQNDTTRQVSVNYFGGPQGTNYLGWAWLYSGSIPGWRMVGVADFNGDGKPDVIWQNDTTRQVSVNYFGGPQGNLGQGWAWLWPGSATGWQVVGTGDFNGDGKPDLVWQNDTARQVTVQYYGGAQGATYLGWAWLCSGSVPGWRAIVK